MVPDHAGQLRIIPAGKEGDEFGFGNGQSKYLKSN